MARLKIPFNEFSAFLSYVKVVYCSFIVLKGRKSGEWKGIKNLENERKGKSEMVGNGNVQRPKNERKRKRMK